MTPREVNALLAHAALVDLRLAALLRDGQNDQPGTQAARVATEWHAYIGTCDFDLALQAVRNHYLSSTDSLLPVHVVDEVAAILSSRAWEPPTLSPADQELCALAGVPAEEFLERRGEPGWVDHLRARWQGVGA